MPDTPNPLTTALSRVGWSNHHLAERLGTGLRTVDRLKHDPHPDLLQYLDTVAKLIEAVPLPKIRKRAARRKRD